MIDERLAEAITSAIARRELEPDIPSLLRADDGISTEGVWFDIVEAGRAAASALTPHGRVGALDLFAIASEISLAAVDTAGEGGGSDSLLVESDPRAGGPGVPPVQAPAPGPPATEEPFDRTRCVEHVYRSLVTAFPDSSDASEGAMDRKRASWLRAELRRARVSTVAALPDDELVRLVDALDRIIRTFRREEFAW